MSVASNIICVLPSYQACFVTFAIAIIILQAQQHGSDMVKYHFSLISFSQNIISAIALHTVIGVKN
jgi:hypothetical protein